MDAIGANNDIGLRRRAVGERYPRDIAALFIADAAMAGMNDAGRQRFRQELDQIGAMHAECRVPSRRIRHLHRRNRRAVVAEILGVAADARAPLLNGWPQPEAIKMPHTVWGYEDAGADLAECGRLFVDVNVESVRDQRVGGEQAADPTAADCHFERRIRHYETPVDRRSCIGTVVSAPSL